MSSPWDPAIAQAMQRHGGSNRSVPKTAPPKPVPPSDVSDLPEPPTQADRDSPSKPEHP
jgi:hypothetical protein